MINYNIYTSNVMATNHYLALEKLLCASLFNDNRKNHMWDAICNKFGYRVCISGVPIKVLCLSIIVIYNYLLVVAYVLII